MPHEGAGIVEEVGAGVSRLRNLIAVDPLASKREMASRLGATHTAADAEAALFGGGNPFDEIPRMLELCDISGADHDRGQYAALFGCFWPRA